MRRAFDYVASHRFLSAASTRLGCIQDQLDFVGRELGIGPSLVFNEGDMWGRSRRIVSPPLSPHSVLGMLPAMTTVSPAPEGGDRCSRFG